MPNQQAIQCRPQIRRRRLPARPGQGRLWLARDSCTAEFQSPSPAASMKDRRCRHRWPIASAGSGRESVSSLAMPQSTTSVSPNRPSITFSGFKSRCTTPRLCAVGNRVAGVDDAAQQSPKNQFSPTRPRRLTLRSVKPLDRLFERLALDQTHRIIRAAIRIPAQAVNRHDPRVLQSAGDSSLSQETRLADLVERVMPL